MVSPVNPDPNQAAIIFAAAQDLYSQIPTAANIEAAELLGPTVDVKFPEIANKVNALIGCLRGNSHENAMTSQLIKYQSSLKEGAEKGDSSAIFKAASGLQKLCLKLEFNELPEQKQKLLISLANWILGGCLFDINEEPVPVEQQENYLLDLFKQLKSDFQGSLLDLPIVSSDDDPILSKGRLLKDLLISNFYYTTRDMRSAHPYHQDDFLVFKTLFQIEKLPPSATLIHAMAFLARSPSNREELFNILIKNNIDFGAPVAAGQEPLIIEIAKVDYQQRSCFRLSKDEWEIFFATGFDLNVKAVHYSVKTESIVETDTPGGRQNRVDTRRNPSLLEIFLSRVPFRPCSEQALCAVNYGANIDCLVTPEEQRQIREALKKNPEVKSLPFITYSQIQLVKQLDDGIYKDACEVILGSPEGLTREQAVQQAINGISADRGAEAASSARADGAADAGTETHMPLDLIHEMIGERGYEKPRLEVATLVRQLRAQRAKVKAEAEAKAAASAAEAKATGETGEAGKSKAARKAGAARAEVSASREGQAAASDRGDAATTNSDGTQGGASAGPQRG